MRFLFIFLLICIYAASTAQIPSYVPTNGLVGWWPFNGNANDESGNGNNGTVNGATLTSDRFGNVGKAFSFNGLSDYIELGNIQGLNSNSGISMSIWINILNGNSSGAYLFLIAPNPNGSFTTSQTDTISVSVTNCSCGIDLGSKFLLQKNVWSNVTMSYDLISGTQKLYINGVLVDVKTEQLYSYYTINNSNSRIGNYHFNSFYFKGLLDDAMVFNRALTQQEITQLYNGIVTPTTPEDTTSNVGIGTITPKRKLHVNDVMRLEPRNSAPSNPAKGDIYFDGVLNKLRVYDGSLWQNCW